MNSPDPLPPRRRSRPPYRLWCGCLALLVGAGLAFPAQAKATPESVQHEAAPVDTAEAAVKAAIEGLFDAMRNGDAEGVRNAFHGDARLVTATSDSLRSGDVERFAEAVGASREAVWDERTYDVRVDIDGPMASAWVPYAFYRGETLSHCGINAVQLVRYGSEWKILQLVDTRRTDCDLPASVRSPEE